MIAPHGGVLINRKADAHERKDWLKYAKGLKEWVVGPRIISDLELIATGAYSPLQGFMGRDDYLSVVRNMHLADGLPWTIPITLPVDEGFASSLRLPEEVVLLDDKSEVLAICHVKDKFDYDKLQEAELVFKSKDIAHPGVEYLLSQGETLLGGPITYLGEKRLEGFSRYHATPQETRNCFAERGWRTIVAFQTRNPIHRAHEYIQKCALETVDGLFLHPLVGQTKGDDIPAEVRLRCYEALLENYYPRDRTFMSVFPAAMRYAGPREAVFHALVRKNYGATHFIVGRDHAGVGMYYGAYDAQKIFFEFNSDEIGITPLFFDYTFYCRRCAQMASEKTCSHRNGARVYLSGTMVRELLAAGQELPGEFTRPEISRILAEAYKRQRF